MLHEPAMKTGHDPAAPFKMRLGVFMFVIYTIVYVGFVAINVIKPILMEKLIFLGLNLAVVYGFSLIILAMALALIYNHVCTKEEKRLAALEVSDSTEEKEEKRLAALGADDSTKEKEGE